MSECDECNANFSADRLGRTVIATTDGRHLDSGITRAPGEHTNPVDRPGIVEKFHTLTGPVLSSARARQIEAMVFGLDTGSGKLRVELEDLYRPAK